MLLIVEKGLNVECAMQYIEHWYTRANNKQIKDSNKGNESSYIMYINQKSALYNINIIYESPEAVTELFNGYFSIVSEWIHNKTKSRGLKMLTSKQKLERLPIALAQTSKSRQ